MLILILRVCFTPSSLCPMYTLSVRIQSTLEVGEMTAEAEAAIVVKKPVRARGSNSWPKCLNAHFQGLFSS